MVAAAPMAQCGGTAGFATCRPAFPVRTPEIGNFGPQKRYLKMPTLLSSSTSRGLVCATVGRDQRRQLKFRDEYDPKPFWLSFIKDVIWSFRALAIFLAEQPGQLKYIEWPGFQSTLKTATLTLFIVAFLIVALSSVDSALCYVLALLVRRAARPP